MMMPACSDSTLILDCPRVLPSDGAHLEPQWLKVTDPKWEGVMEENTAPDLGINSADNLEESRERNLQVEEEIHTRENLDPEVGKHLEIGLQDDLKADLTGVR